jgi:hypothetical protein
MGNCFRASFLFLILFAYPFLIKGQQPNLIDYKPLADSVMLSGIDTVAIISDKDSLASSERSIEKKHEFTADTLFLKNGDKITGKIISLEQGRLKIDAQGPGVVSIKWYKISSIAGGNRLYKIENVDGGIYFGHIECSKDTGKITIANLLKFDISLENISKIFPIEEEWYRGFKGSFGGGLSYAKSTDVLTVNTEYNLYYVLSKWTFINNFSFVSTSTSNEAASLRIQTNLQALYSLPKKWVLSEMNSFNKNDQLGINSRYTFGVQAGNNIVQTEWQKLLALTGVNANFEKDNGQNNEDANLEWPVSIQHTIYKFFRPNLASTTAVTYYTGLTQKGRKRWDLNTDITWEFIKNFKLQLSFYYDYDNKRIEGKTSNSDFGTTLSILIDLK